MKNVAILLAAGKGSRMKTDTPKQFLSIDGKMIVCYSLEAFERCEFLDAVIVVTGSDQIDYVKDITAGFSKVKAVVAGGAERYLSVYNALSCIMEAGGADYAFIHDSARPYISEELLLRLYEDVMSCGACIPAVAVRDTVKVVKEGFIETTPSRSTLFAAQTPQCFSFDAIYRAYKALVDKMGESASVTDDAQVMELFGNMKVKITEGDYKNTKITVIEDLK